VEQYAHFNTAFVVLNNPDIEEYLEVAFRSLRRESKKIINGKGKFSITMTVEALKDDCNSEVKLEEVA
jgi:hypothetical protein